MYDRINLRIFHYYKKFISIKIKEDANLNTITISGHN